MHKITILMIFLFVIPFTHSADYFNLRHGLENSRLVFEQTQKGRVVFLGGSITYMKGWRQLVAENLKQRFPKTEFEFINAGISSTGSTVGAFRLGRDVFKNGQVDLLFEEAAVNDARIGYSDKQQIRAMEGIVRHARKLNPSIDIVLMHFVDPEKIQTYNQGETPQVILNHESVAAHYNLPSINLALEVTERIQRKEFSWEKDFKNVHPSPFGHQLYSRTIARMFDGAWQENIKNQKITPYPLLNKMDEVSYDLGKLISPEKAKIINGFKFELKWANKVGGKTRLGFVDVPMLVGTQPQDSFQINFEGTAIGLFVVAGPDAGIIEFKVDDGTWHKKDLFTNHSKRLHIPRLYMLASELKRGEEHLLTVRLSNKKNKNSKGYASRIVHFAVNGK
jgi:sialidase-1